MEAALIRAGRVLGNFNSPVGVIYGDLEVSASYETGPYFTVLSAQFASGSHLLGLELPIPLFKIANRGFSGGMGRKLANISELLKPAQDQRNFTFVHGWEQELCINWLARVCAVILMLWKWNCC